MLEFPRVSLVIIWIYVYIYGDYDMGHLLSKRDLTIDLSLVVHLVDVVSQIVCFIIDILHCHQRIQRESLRGPWVAALRHGMIELPSWAKGDKRTELFGSAESHTHGVFGSLNAYDRKC